MFQNINQIVKNKVEKSIRGEICHSIYGCAKANNT